MPSKADVLPGSARIDTLDVPATQRQFLNIELLPSSRLTAADYEWLGRCFALTTGIRPQDQIELELIS